MSPSKRATERVNNRAAEHAIRNVLCQFHRKGVDLTVMNAAMDTSERNPELVMRDILPNMITLLEWGVHYFAELNPAQKMTLAFVLMSFFVMGDPNDLVSVFDDIVASLALFHRRKLRYMTTYRKPKHHRQT